MEYKDINDYEVLYLVEENQSDYKEIMFKKYEPILKRLSSKFFYKMKNLGVEFEDVYQEALIGFNYAIDHFDFSKDLKYIDEKTYTEISKENDEIINLMHLVMEKFLVNIDRLFTEEEVEDVSTDEVLKAVEDMLKDTNISVKDAYEKLAFAFELESDDGMTAKVVFDGASVQVFSGKTGELVSSMQAETLDDFLDALKETLTQGGNEQESDEEVSEEEQSHEQSSSDEEESVDDDEIIEDDDEEIIEDGDEEVIEDEDKEESSSKEKKVGQRLATKK